MGRARCAPCTQSPAALKHLAGPVGQPAAFWFVLGVVCSPPLRGCSMHLCKLLQGVKVVRERGEDGEQQQKPSWQAKDLSPPSQEGERRKLLCSFIKHRTEPPRSLQQLWLPRSTFLLLEICCYLCGGVEELIAASSASCGKAGA